MPPAPTLLLWLAQIAATLAPAEAAISDGKYNVALTQLQAIPTRTARWHLLASKAWEGLEDPAKAVAEAEAALRQEPGNAANHVQLAQIFLENNTPQAALEVFDGALALFPDMYLLRLGKGLSLKELQLYSEAERELHWCLERRPESALAFDALATIYLHLSRFEEARTLSQAFLARNDSEARGYYFLAAARAGEWAAADETLRLLAESLRRNPSFAAAHALLGKLLLREGKARAADAAAHLRKAAELRPDLVEAHLHLAQALRWLGDEAGAAREFDTVRRLKAKEREPRKELLYHRGSR